MAAEESPTSLLHLSDDLLVSVLSNLKSGSLRRLARTSRRFATLLRDRQELWGDVELELPPRRSRGRDRRNSYTTPCALNTQRLAAWLEHRRGAIARLRVRLLYPDALPLLGELLPPLAPALRRLVLEGGCTDWPYLWVDWRWLAGMSRLESLELWDALPSMMELQLPPSLTELHVDRVGEGEQETEGWDELPPCFSRLTALQKVTLGTAATYLLQGEEESALAPLRAARGALRELRLPDGAVSAVPDAVAAFSRLTLLSFRGCDKLDAFGETCVHKADPFAPLAALRELRHLDFSSCALDSVPPHIGTLPLRTLLLAGNRLRDLPPSGAAAASAAACLSAALASAQAGGGGRRRRQQQQSPPQLPLMPLQLEHLDVSGNHFAALPEQGLTGLSALSSLDVSRCWAMHAAGPDWQRLLGALPALRLLRHSCELLAAEAARMQSSLPPDLRLERVPEAGAALAGVQQVGAVSGSGGAKRARSCSSLEALEEEAAAALLSGGGGGGGGWAGGGGGGATAGSSGGQGELHGATLADLATAMHAEGNAGLP